METITCDGVEIEIDDFSKLILDQIITMADLLEFKRSEYFNHYHAQRICSFIFQGSSYDIAIQINTTTNHIEARKERDSHMRNHNKLANLTGNNNFETLENVLKVL